MKRKAATRAYPELAPNARLNKLARIGGKNGQTLHSFADSGAELLIVSPEPDSSAVPCFARREHVVRYPSSTSPDSIDDKALLIRTADGQYQSKVHEYYDDKAGFGGRMLRLGLTDRSFAETAYAETPEEARRYQTIAGSRTRRHRSRRLTDTRTYKFALQAGQDNPDLLVQRRDGSFVGLWPKLEGLPDLPAVKARYDAVKTWIKAPDFIYYKEADYEWLDRERSLPVGTSAARIVRGLAAGDDDGLWSDAMVRPDAAGTGLESAHAGSAPDTGPSRLDGQAALLQTLRSWAEATQSGPRNEKLEVQHATDVVDQLYRNDAVTQCAGENDALTAIAKDYERGLRRGRVQQTFVGNQEMKNRLDHLIQAEGKASGRLRPGDEPVQFWTRRGAAGLQAGHHIVFTSSYSSHGIEEGDAGIITKIKDGAITFHVTHRGESVTFKACKSRADKDGLKGFQRDEPRTVFSYSQELGSNEAGERADDVLVLHSWRNKKNEMHALCAKADGRVKIFLSSEDTPSKQKFAWQISRATDFALAKFPSLPHYEIVQMRADDRAVKYASWREISTNSVLPPLAAQRERDDPASEAPGTEARPRSPIARLGTPARRNSWLDRIADRVRSGQTTTPAQPDKGRKEREDRGQSR